MITALEVLKGLFAIIGFILFMAAFIDDVMTIKIYRLLTLMMALYIVVDLVKMGMNSAS